MIVPPILRSQKQSRMSTISIYHPPSITLPPPPASHPTTVHTSVGGSYNYVITFASEKFFGLADNIPAGGGSPAERVGVVLRSRGVPAILAEGYRGSLQSFQMNASIRLCPLPFKSFPTHYSLIILPLDAIQSEVLTVSSNKPQNGKPRKPSRNAYGVVKYCCMSHSSVCNVGRKRPACNGVISAHVTKPERERGRQSQGLRASH